MMVVITVSLIVVQEMAARMGAVTGKGLADLIREQYGIRWSVFATLERARREPRHLHLRVRRHRRRARPRRCPDVLSVPVAALAVWLLLVRGSYKVAERIFVLMTIPFFAYPIAAILAHPHWGQVGKAIVVPHVQTSTCVPPPVRRDRGHDDHAVHAAVRPVGGRRARHRPGRSRRERAEVVTGSIFANLVASFIIIATAATLYVHGEHHVGTAPTRRRRSPVRGRFAEVLFAVGLLGASLLAAAILPVTAAYVVAETLGDQGQPRRPRNSRSLGVITS